MLLASAIAEREQRFDAVRKLVSTNGASPGYHTRVREGQLVHSTLDSAQYAQLLLMRGQPADVSRAALILDRLLALQVTEPTSLHYGLWGWFAEEPPEEMAPADWNWADFIGARLAEILHAHPASLAPDLVQRLQSALRHACNAIVKRNVGPGYTNICAMGAAVTLAAGELLPDPGFLDYGRRRLAAQREALAANGGVPEYNSPHYGTVFILELERVLRLVSDPAARADADWMRRRSWELTASQFHPGTGQWAGAQGRVYNDLLGPDATLLIWQRTGITSFGANGHTFAPGPDLLHDRAELACPPESCARFAALPASPCEQEQIWMPATAQKPTVILHTWFSDTSTLGSVNTSTTWVQHRPVTAYWRDSEDSVASAKVILLKDGREFATGCVRIRQTGPRILLVLGLATGQGDWHVSLDRPADGCFSARDLRLRVLLSSPFARLDPAPPAPFYTLAAGPGRLVLHPGPVFFDGRPGAWIAGADASSAYLDAVLYQGPHFTFAPDRLAETCAGLGAELLDGATPATNAPLVSTIRDALRLWSWSPVEGEIEAPISLLNAPMQPAFLS